MREEDLFLPIKLYFEAFGYNIDGEVGHLDMLCEKDGQFIAIELKNDLNFKIFMQAAKQQKLFESVFIGCWTPKNLRSRAFSDKVYMLNRLGIGLILVSARTKEVTVFCEPIEHSISSYTARNRSKKNRMVQEFTARRMKNNTGGIHNKKLVTAYRENSLIVLGFLFEHGPSKASTIKKLMHINNAYAIVYQNHYDWFEKVDNGVYNLTQKGVAAFEAEKELICRLISFQQQKVNEELNNEYYGK